MKKILVVPMLLAVRAAAAADAGYALLRLESAGMEVRGLSGADVAGGRFVEAESSGLARYSKKECAEKIKASLMEERGYSSSFSYFANGAYGLDGGVGRMLCLEYGLAGKYYRQGEFMNADLSAFFKDNGKSVPAKFAEKDFSAYSIFPLEKDDGGLGAKLSSDIKSLTATLQKTSFDCGGELGFAEDTICHDRKLAAMDVAVAKLESELSAKHAEAVDGAWRANLRQAMYPAGIEKLYRARISYLRCVKEKDSPEKCASLKR
ncbi:MAG: hypothetical protein LBO78_00760 [Rickettsiales bacterium]|jgi:hypothetical protein|nr:hypothetical protein [Rickettsiales bacterium]